MATGTQLATKGIIPKHQKVHGVSIATKGYISALGLAGIKAEEITLTSIINIGLSLGSEV